MIVEAPGSSANVGAGFDSLALAVDLPFLLGTERFSASSTSDVPEAHVAESSHPAAIAYAEAGGASPELWWSSRIPPGRGVGFSGAARVAGYFLASIEQGMEPRDAQNRAFEMASVSEGHPDNAAASAFGGLVVATGQSSLSVPVTASLQVALWWPQTKTLTDLSRKALPEMVPLEDAVFNIGRAALFVGAMTSGHIDVLRDATRDRLHQDRRLEAIPESAEMIDSFYEAGAVAAWLGGSGPTVAGLILRETTSRFVAAIKKPLSVLDVATYGARVVKG